MSDFVNDKNIGKPVISILNTDSLYSKNSTFYDKWSVFRFVITNPEVSNSVNVELRKYRLREDGTKEFCDEKTSYTLDKSDPKVLDAVNTLITLAIQKGVELDHFRH